MKIKKQVELRMWALRRVRGSLDFFFFFYNRQLAKLG